MIMFDLVALQTILRLKHRGTPVSWLLIWKSIVANHHMSKIGNFPWYVLKPDSRVLGLYEHDEQKLFESVRIYTMLEF